MVAGGAGWHCRARMLSTTSALQAPQVERFGAGRLDRLQPVLLNRREDPHELPVTVVATRQPSPYAAERAGQLPALEGRAVPQRTRLPRQDRHVVPRIVGDLAAPEAPGMLGDGLAVLADDDPIGVGPHVDRPPDGTGGDAVVVVVEAHQTGLGHRHLGGVEAVEGAAIGHQEGPLLLEHLPHCLALDRRMRPLLGVLDTPIHQPLVDLGVGAAPRDGHEQAAADVTHLPLDLALLPARTRSARHRLHQMVGAQLQKAPVVGALLANEDHAHRRLHVVVDAPPADPAEEVEGPFVRLEHHLLALAREDLNQLHAAVAEPHVRRLHLGRHTRQARVLVAPVELVGLAGIEAQRHKTLRWRQPPPPGPGRHRRSRRQVLA